MIRRLLSQRGSALVSAMGVMSVMGIAGLATFATVDVQQGQSRAERTGESSFNLAEAALNTQAFVLSRDWPGTAQGAYPSSCSQQSGGRGCPESKAIKSSFKNFDLDDGSATWETAVRDDGGSNPNYYNDAVVSAQPSWDANQNDRVWVRSSSIVQGKKRTVVALVRVDVINEQMPMNVLTAGHIGTNNNGNKTIVDNGGRPLAVRCRSENNPRCLSFRNGQVQPPGTVQQGYPGGAALTPAALDRLRTRAMAMGTHHQGCPSSMTGEVVFVEGPADCNYNSGGNSPSSPGVFVIMNGTLHLGGNGEYYGLVYMGNLQNSSDYVITMRGTSLIQGAVAIDGAGGIEAGSSKENLIFDATPFNRLRSYGAAGIVQNSWREISGQ